MEKGLSTWQLTMMALGTVIGGSFFLGSSLSIRAAGPGVIISFLLAGILAYFILYALSEMTVADPVQGSFRTYAEKAYGPALGFVVGWVYWTGLVLAMSSEATAVSYFLQEWFPGISLPVVGSFIIIAVTLLNLLGAERLSKLESALSAVKLLAIIGFIIFGALLIIGFIPGRPAVGAGSLSGEPILPNGIGGIAGSMLLVVSAFAGFEIIGLAASETKDPVKTVPKAINYTVFGLIGLYIAAIVVLLPLIPTASLSEEVSPMVAALMRQGQGWAGNIINIVLVTAILSTMLAAMFGLGRMIRSLAEGGYAPSWIKGEGDVPYKGILFSGAAMLIALAAGLLLPAQVYVFLISSGSFSLLFTYGVIVAAHYRLRKQNGCPPEGKCQFPGYPISSWVVLISIIAIIASMPLIEGQGVGLAAGLALLVFYSLIYVIVQSRKKSALAAEGKLSYNFEKFQANTGMETAEEIAPVNQQDDKKNCKKE